MINTENWKEFKISDLFTISGSKTTKVEELEEYGNGVYPYVTTKASNNGVDCFYNFYTEDGNCLTIDSAVLGYCSYQELPFSASDHVEILRPKFNMNFNVALFFVTIINLDTYRYSYGRKRSQKQIKKDLIKLPVDEHGKPDYKFMNDYIEELQTRERESEGTIKDSLKTDIKTEKKNIFVEDWKTFKIKDIFKIYTGKDLIYSTLVPGTYDVVGHGKDNLGLVGKSELLEGYPLFDNKKTISLADRGNFYATARPAPFYVGTRVKALTYKFEDCDLYSLMFIANIINQEEFRFTYGRNSTNKLPELEIKLPVKKDGTPDCYYMSKIIKSLPYSDRI